MDLDEALRVRHLHRAAPRDWAQLCAVCAVSWPCPPWRRSSLTIMEWIRDAFAGVPARGRS